MDEVIVGDLMLVEQVTYFVLEAARVKMEELYWRLVRVSDTWPADSVEALHQEAKAAQEEYYRLYDLYWAGT